MFKINDELHLFFFTAIGLSGLRSCSGSSFMSESIKIHKKENNHENPKIPKKKKTDSKQKNHCAFE
jgi:hypothetical protein